MHKIGSRSVAELSSTTQQWPCWVTALSRPAVRQHGMTVKELIEFLLTSRQILTAVLNRLERLGLIEQVRTAADGRIRRIRLTKHGAKKSGTRYWPMLALTISVPSTASQTRSV